MNPHSLGVIVARFQVPELHAGHRHLLNYVLQRHAQVLVVLGESEATLTDRNPLDMATRVAMVTAAYPSVRVVGLLDARNDQTWSNHLDTLIDREFPGLTAVLYGARDSFIEFYHGRHTCHSVPTVACPSATEARRQIDRPLTSAAFRRGVIYAARQRYPTSFQVVDVAILSHDRQSVLLGQKGDDGDQWRFIGGFVNPTDPSLERAAKREVTEETSMIETDNYRYLGSARVEDFRYPTGSKDTIMTAFFVADYIFGAPIASDDLARLTWRSLDGLEESLVPEHQSLAAMLRTHLAGHNS